MSTWQRWDADPASPSADRHELAADRPTRLRPGKPKYIEVWKPAAGRAYTVWLLGEPERYFTHWSESRKGTFPCDGPACPECRMKVRRKKEAYFAAAVLVCDAKDNEPVLNAEGDQLWDPVVLRVQEGMLNLSKPAGYAGRIYRVTVTPHGRGKQYLFELRHKREPIVPEFSVPDVMAHYWEPEAGRPRPQLHRLAAATAAPTAVQPVAPAGPQRSALEQLAEQVAEMSNAELVLFHDKLAVENAMPSRLAVYAAELKRRGIVTSEMPTPKHQGNGTSTGKRFKLGVHATPIDTPTGRGPAEVPKEPVARKAVIDLANHFGNPIDGVNGKECA